MCCKSKASWTEQLPFAGWKLSSVFYFEKWRKNFAIGRANACPLLFLQVFFITLYSLLLSLLFSYVGELQKDDGDDGEKMKVLKKHLRLLDYKLKERLLCDTLLK